MNLQPGLEKESVLSSMLYTTLCSFLMISSDAVALGSAKQSHIPFMAFGM